MLCQRYPEHETFIKTSLDKQFGRAVRLESRGTYELKSREVVWVVTDRNSRKHKKYIKVASKMKGIQNPSNCKIVDI